MEIVECKDETAWIQAINTWLAKHFLGVSYGRLFLPAGETPRPLYKNWEQSGAPFAPTTRLVQLDEILSGPKKQAFTQFFVSTLPSYQSQFEFIELAETAADFAILGLGPNGHVAFHEPGLSSEFYSGCITLNPETIARIGLSPGDRAVTYGLGAFMRAKAIVLILRGESKREILQEILKPDCTLPAAHLLRHPKLTIMTDFKISQ